MKKQFQVTQQQSGQRLDVFCVNQATGHSRATLQRAIKAGDIQVNRAIVKPRYLLKEADVVAIDITAEPAPDPIPPGLLTIPTVYEDKDVVVINKPAGSAAHPGVGPVTPTVASWFAEHYPASRTVGENAERPGIVHRLDKDTSGLMILAKNDAAYQHLKRQFAKRRVHKEYLALVFGVPKAHDGRINQPLKRSRRNPLRRAIDRLGKEKPGGSPASLRSKRAITEWQIEQTYDRFALLRALPLTGRMHQIRVHFHFLGHPIVGDPLYTFKRQHAPQGVTRQLLHAEKLTLNLPSGKKKTFTAPLPSDFQQVLDNLQPS